MAIVHSPEGLTSPAQARRSTYPAAPKLRDSCDACSASKVKCDKEKPTCARCTKKDVRCEYCVTKRAGRKHDSRPSDQTELTPALPWTSSPPSIDIGFQTSPTNSIQPNSWPPTSGYSDMLNFLPPADPASTSALLTTFSTNSNDLFTFPFPDSSDLEMLNQPTFDFGGINNNNNNNDLLDSTGATAFPIPEDPFSVIDEAIFDLPTISKTKSHSPPSSRDSIRSDPQNFQKSRSQSPCCCLIRALSLLKQLFPNASTACTRSTGQGHDNATGQLPTIQSVISENEETIKVIDNLLQCACSRDSYLLAILSLIVFKVLGWYAAAARETHIKDDNSNQISNIKIHHRRDSLCHSEQTTGIGGGAINGEDQDRVAAQLVLSELHRVQRLVNILAQRLKLYGTGSGMGTPNGTADAEDAFEEKTTSAFSATMMDQLEADLRKRLRSLSLDIVEMLRQG
uniref:Putative C6 transcription factor n=1 Tax=Cladonia uncialis subsp. uncialis TaxID=180999 RepID=A0A1Z1CBE6_CLAUC|nr:putative C6 transcription factor [Cladonia uncialis subsp. uncialis]AUW31248.1 putative C6 transcription factor [Cladonia uncialis subsp. uncialis]